MGTQNNTEKTESSLAAVAREAIEQAKQTEKPQDTEGARDPMEECPRCGWLREGTPTAPEEDSKEYLRSILAGRPFKKEYRLHDGDIILKFTTMTMEEGEFVNKVMLHNDYDTELELRDIAGKVKLLHYLEGMQLGGKEVVFEKENLSDFATPTIAAEYLKRFAGYDETLMRTIHRTCGVFQNLLNLLVGDGFDENFWKGVGPY